MFEPESKIEILARRAYPNLKKSGLCSQHRDDGYYECTVCYPDWVKLFEAHLEVFDQLYKQILELSGLSDPPNGRIGTNKIIEELKRKLENER